MKAIISNRIYLNKPEEGFDSIKEALTYKLEKVIPDTRSKRMVKSIEIIKNYTTVSSTVLSIPQGRLDLIPKKFSLVDKRILNPVVFPEPKVPLREDQKEVYYSADDSCFINALPGWGKTFTALYLAKKLGQKTLVVTTTTFIRDQWIEEVRKLFDIEPGILGSSKYNIDSPIVIGNVQTVTKYWLELAKEFGTLIIDEAHHCPATTFTNIVDNSYARYRIGLSGTMQRKDGKHILFKDYFGSSTYKPDQANTIDPVINIITPGISLPRESTWAKKINTLLYDEDYQQFIASLAAKQILNGHFVLVVADRVEFLKNVTEILGDQCILVTGTTPQEERETIKNKIESGEITCIAGSRQIFSEGISINRLSCLILASPIVGEALLEQVIGRIMRKHDRKRDPVVLDINFSSFTDKKQNEIRTNFYRNKGWEIYKM